MERGHDERVLGRHAGCDRLPHHPVHVTVVDDVVGVAVVRAERDAAGAVLADEREEVDQVPGHRRLANEEPHPGA